MRASDFKTARLKLGLSQSKMGEALGLTKRQVINLETGKTPIRHAYAELLNRVVIEHLSAPGAPRLETKDENT